MARAALSIIFLVLQLLHLGSSGSVKDSNLLISDGLDGKLISLQQSSSLLQAVDDLEADTVTCEPIYGFLPCATSVRGLIFMVFVYEILLFLANLCITSGSELLLKMYGSGLFGSTVFHLLGTIPQMGIVVVTGVTATAETAEAMAAMNIAMVAGSAIMLLTLVWGTAVAFGSRANQGETNISESATPSNQGDTDITECATPSNQGDTNISERATPSNQGDTNITECATPSNQGDTNISECAAPSNQGDTNISECATPSNQGATNISDISECATPSNQGDTKGFCSTVILHLSYGVSTDVKTRDTARIMMVSLIPFLILLVAKVLNSTTWIIVSLLVSSTFLVIYCTHQVFAEWIQERSLKLLTDVNVQKTLPSFLTASDPNASNIQEVSARTYQNKVTGIPGRELKSLIKGIRIGQAGLKSDSVQKAMKNFDMSGHSQIYGISIWVIPSSKSEEAEGLEGVQKQGTGKKKSKLTDKSRCNHIKVACFLILGIVIMIVLPNPLMETIQDLSTAASIPSFFTSYFLIPFAINIGLLWQTLTSAQDETENAISLILSEIYNGVFLSNIMGLTIFLLIVYIRNLSWDCSLAVFVVLLFCSVTGIYTSCSRNYPFWTCIIAYSVYLISLPIVYVLTTFF